MNSTVASLLGLLDAYGGEMTGGELVRVAQQHIGQFWSLTRSQVYRELAALEKEGLVRPGATGQRDARPVRVTDAGRAAYREWLTEHLPSDTIRIPVLLAVAFGSALDTAALTEVLARSHADHRARLEEYRQLDAHLAQAEDPEPWTRATLSFGIHYEEAVLKWFTTLPPEVRPAWPAEKDARTGLR